MDTPKMTFLTIEERVAAGFALLTARAPGWWERIDVEQMNMQNGTPSPCGCVVAQSTDQPFWTAIVRLGLADEDEIERHGFYIDPDYYDGESPDGARRALAARYAALTAEWRRVITERRASSVDGPG